MHMVQDSNPLPRLFAVVPLATMATLVLFFIMARMVYTDVVVINPEPYPRIPSIVMEPPTKDPVPHPRPTREDVSDPPPPLPQDEWVRPGGTENGPITLPPVSEGSGATLGGMDGLPFARMMAPPTYPAQAARRGIEGYVDLRFDVTASGATANIHILGAQPEGVFEKAAIDAVARWRFQPRMIDGEPHPFHGLSKRLRFTLDKS